MKKTKNTHLMTCKRDRRVAVAESPQPPRKAIWEKQHSSAPDYDSHTLIPVIAFLGVCIGGNVEILMNMHVQSLTTHSILHYRNDRDRLTTRIWSMYDSLCDII